MSTDARRRTDTGTSLAAARLPRRPAGQTRRRSTLDLEVPIHTVTVVTGGLAR